MKKLITLTIAWLSAIAGICQTDSTSTKDSTKKEKKHNIELGVHSMGYAGIPGTVLSRNPNLDINWSIKLPYGFSFFAMKAQDVVDYKTPANYLFAQLTKSWAFKKAWQVTGKLAWFDYQTKKFVDGEQGIVMPRLSIQYSKKYWFKAEYTRFLVYQPKFDGNIIELSGGGKIASLHTWINTGTFQSDPGVSIGLRLKPQGKISIGKLKGSVILDGNMNITNRLNSSRKASAREALVLRTYWGLGKTCFVFVPKRPGNTGRFFRLQKTAYCL